LRSGSDECESAFTAPGTYTSGDRTTIVA
jgi:hypothetical protein